MDFSGFGDDNWEVKKWLNSAFVDVAKDKRDAHAAALLTKLQLVSQDIARYDFLNYKSKKRAKKNDELLISISFF